jgi:hypothetical protein
MGLFDSIIGTVESAVGNVFGSTADAGNLGSYLGGPVDSGNVGSSPFPVSAPAPAPVYMNTMASVPMMIQGAGRMLQRFPNLSTSLIALSQQFGKRFTADQVWRMVKSAGPQMVVGLIGAAAMQELFVWKTTHKTRRMNVANTKALRRSVRRLKGFDRLAHRVSGQLARVGGTRRRSASRRCGTCKKSPCSC